jgi:hypothetical protein
VTLRENGAQGRNKRRTKSGDSTTHSFKRWATTEKKKRKVENKQEKTRKLVETVASVVLGSAGTDAGTTCAAAAGTNASTTTTTRRAAAEASYRHRSRATHCGRRPNARPSRTATERTRHDADPVHVLRADPGRATSTHS